MSNDTDPRIKQLSYSSLLTLHSCPRKFQLYKLNHIEAAPDDIPSSITLSYGHAVGTGIQFILEGRSIEEAIWEAFVHWNPDLFAANDKQNKSLWGAIHALRQFAHMRANGYLEDWELVYYEGKPACELSFSITLPDGYVYRGFVDAVLKHRTTGEVMVLECKTTASPSVNPATYKNSAQAIGYSIVLDAIFPELSSYQVLYLIYQAKSEEFTQIPFTKSYYQRALWIQELLLDVEMIKIYENAGIYPMHGESCYNFFRECEYYQSCTLSTSRITTPLSDEISQRIEADNAKYQIRITLADLLTSQLAHQNVVGDNQIQSNVQNLSPSTSESDDWILN